MSLRRIFSAIVSAFIISSGLPACAADPATASPTTTGVGAVVWRDLDNAVVPIIERQPGAGYIFVDENGLVWNVKTDDKSPEMTVTAVLTQGRCNNPGDVFSLDGLPFGLRSSIEGRANGTFLKFKADAKPAFATSSRIPPEWGLRCEDTEPVVKPAFPYKFPLQPEFVRE